ncbi:PaaX family transcriptional regulator C-terminal domain-containing protein [Solicola sp. PLA-1-18]|uniref:PaaX family transcriptional regulator n=1 Tax=Solicola sp. PLA-1-18 TaxID=3380532 RepID=UPI003B7C64F8
MDLSVVPTPLPRGTAPTEDADGMMWAVAPRPRSLILDLFGDYLRYTDAEVRLGHLSTLMAEFGVAPATVRVTVSRLRREGWFTTRREGRETVYRLSESMLDVLETGRQRIFASAPTRWDGTWTMVIYQVSESERQGREHLRKQLAWHGFGPLTTSTWLAPGDRCDEISSVVAEVPSAQIDVMTCRTGDLDRDRDLAGRCWDLDTLAQEYRAFDDDSRHLLGHVDDLSGADALVTRTNLVTTYRHFPFQDPRLPPELRPSDWPGERAHELFTTAHDRLGPAAREHVAAVLGREVQEA